MLLLAVGGVGVGISRAVLPLEADGLVDKEVTGDGVAGSADGEANDDTYYFPELVNILSVRMPDMSVC